MTYKSPEQVNKEIDQQFDFKWGEKPVETSAKVKSFISSIRTADLQSIREWAEKEKKPQLEKSDPDNYEACYAIAGYNGAIQALLSHLSTLSSSSEKGTPPNEIKE